MPYLFFPSVTAGGPYSALASPRGLLAVLGLFLAIAVIKVPDTFAQTPPLSSGTTTQVDAERTQLEKDKLKLEIEELRDELHWLSRALRLTAVFIPLTVVAVGAVATYFVNRRLNDLKTAEDTRLQAQKETEVNRQAAEQREAARFTTLVEDRARAYALAYAKLSPTALYFPASDIEPGASASSLVAPAPAEPKPAAPTSAVPSARGKDSPQLTRDDCARMGRQLSSWYFGDGGLLMTEDSRNAYFALMEGLRRAVGSPKELAVQSVGEHAQVISLTLISGYRKALSKKYPQFEKLEAESPITDTDLPEWEFGSVPNPTSDAERFKDYVLIQTLASRFRTTLTDDIGSRKPPASGAKKVPLVT